MLAAASCARFHRGEGRRRHRAKGGQESQGEAGTLHASVFQTLVLRLLTGWQKSTCPWRDESTSCA